jgi:hypothetical protein
MTCCYLYGALQRMVYGAGGVLFWLDDLPIPTVSFGVLIYLQDMYS